MREWGIDPQASADCDLSVLVRIGDPIVKRSVVIGIGDWQFRESISTCAELDANPVSKEYPLTCPLLHDLYSKPAPIRHVFSFNLVIVELRPR